jgi:hypothetical protein
LLSPIGQIESNNIPTSPISFLTIPQTLVVQSSTSAASQFHVPAGSIPIRVAPKPKSCKRTKKVFFNDRGFPDESEDYDANLSNIDGSIVLCQKKYAAPDLTTINPLFNYKFDEAFYGAQLAKDLNVSHLQPDQALRLTDLIKCYWTIFDTHGTFAPVRFYQCVIDTGNHKPIAIKKITYGPRKTVIMQQSIAALEKVGHICQIHGS